MSGSLMMLKLEKKGQSLRRRRRRWENSRVIISGCSGFEKRDVKQQRQFNLLFDMLIFVQRGAAKSIQTTYTGKQFSKIIYRRRHNAVLTHGKASRVWRFKSTWPNCINCGADRRGKRSSFFVNVQTSLPPENILINFHWLIRRPNVLFHQQYKNILFTVAEAVWVRRNRNCRERWEDNQQL